MRAFQVFSTEWASYNWPVIGLFAIFTSIYAWCVWARVLCFMGLECVQVTPRLLGGAPRRRDRIAGRLFGIEVESQPCSQGERESRGIFDIRARGQCTARVALHVRGSVRCTCEERKRNGSVRSQRTVAVSAALCRARGSRIRTHTQTPLGLSKQQQMDAGSRVCVLAIVQGDHRRR